MSISPGGRRSVASRPSARCSECSSTPRPQNPRNQQTGTPPHADTRRAAPHVCAHRAAHQRSARSETRAPSYPREARLLAGRGGVASQHECRSRSVCSRPRLCANRLRQKCPPRSVRPLKVPLVREGGLVDRSGAATARPVTCLLTLVQSPSAIRVGPMFSLQASSAACRCCCRSTILGPRRLRSSSGW